MKNLWIATVVTCAMAGTGYSDEPLREGGFLEKVPSWFCKVKVSDLPCSEIFVGSASFVGPRTILTCAHNVRDKKNSPENWDVDAVMNDGTVLEKVVVKSYDADLDLAVLYITELSVPDHEYLRVAGPEKPSGEVSAVGYDPDEGAIVGRRGPVLPGRAGNNMEGPLCNFKVRIKVVQGMSGGPVLDKNGAVCGVCVTSSWDRDRKSYAVMPGYLRRILGVD